MIDKRVAIGALARNCEQNLPENIERIEELRKKFSYSAVFVYENNSTDSTRNILQKWSSTSNGVWVKSEDIDESPYKSSKKVGRLYRGTEVGRIRKMCDCRNKLLDMICNKTPFDYVIFVDIDIAWFSIDGVVSAIQNAPEGWGGLFANCYCIFNDGGENVVRSSYYDTFAFLNKDGKPERMKLSDLNKFRRYKLSFQISKLIRNFKYLECESAFGGIGIYNGKSIEGLSYEAFIPSSWKSNFVCPCEHIFFNSKINSPKFVSKDLEVCYNDFQLSNGKFLFFRMFPRVYYFIGFLKGLVTIS